MLHSWQVEAGGKKWLPGKYQRGALTRNTNHYSTLTKDTATEELPVASQAPKAPRSSCGSDLELQMPCLPCSNEKVTVFCFLYFFFTERNVTGNRGRHYSKVQLLTLKALPPPNTALS